MDNSYSCGQGTFVNAESMYHYQIAVGEVLKQVCFTIFFHKVLRQDACNTDHLMESRMPPECKPLYFESVRTFYVVFSPSYKEKLCAHMKWLLEYYEHAHPEEAPIPITFRFSAEREIEARATQAQLYTMDEDGVIEKDENASSAYNSISMISSDEFIYLLEWCIDLGIFNPLTILDMLDRCHVSYTYATDLDDIINFRPDDEACEQHNLDE